MEIKDIDGRVFPMARHGPVLDLGRTLADGDRIGNLRVVCRLLRMVRDECLSEHWFPSLLHARTGIKTWRREYNEERPKKALGGLTPAAHAEQLK